jgi:hypothetical protein
MIMHYLNRANKQERSFYYIYRFANGKRNYRYGKELITEDMHKDKRDELEKQKEKKDADIAKINADEDIQLSVEREKEKNTISKEASDLKKKRAAAEKKAKKKAKEIEKLSGKYEKYENETQASAIMTTLSMTFISLCQWLLSTYFK